jgi:TRAP-type C4-dicarboxylate transport system permease small subunit
MRPVSAWLERIDRMTYRGERAIVVVALLVMSFLVFLDVVHRRYTDPESKSATLIGKVLGIAPGSESWNFLQEYAVVGIAAVFVALFYVGIRTASDRRLWRFRDGPNMAPTRGKALAIAIALTGGCWLAMRMLFGSGEVMDFEYCDSTGYDFDCGVFPNGLVWSQPVSLILMAWVGFLGASMATRDNRHLKVEAVQRRLPKHLRRWSGLVGGLLTALFAVLLAYWGFRFVGAKLDEYIAADGLGGFHDGIDFPRFQGFLIIPTAYSIMALRFVVRGIKAYRGELDDTPTELADLDLDLELELDEPSEKASEKPSEAEAAT